LEDSSVIAAVVVEDVRRTTACSRRPARQHLPPAPAACAALLGPLLLPAPAACAALLAPLLPVPAARSCCLRCAALLLPALRGGAAPPCLALRR